MSTQAYDDSASRRLPATASRRRDAEQQTDLALEDPRPCSVAHAWHWRHGLGTNGSAGTSA
jgi:hypothetical protein